jgi:predicted transcriptional regulator
LEQEVQRLSPIEPILYEIAIESLLEHGFIIHHKSFLRDEYEITEKGKVAALLTKEMYQEIKKGEGEESF